MSVDLDDLLNDVDLSALKTKAVDKIAVKNTPTKPGTEKTGEANKELIASEVRPWLAASANVPKETRERWTRMVKTDSGAELVSRFQRSSAYSEWDTSSSKRGVNKCLQDLVRNALSKSNLPEAKVARVMTMVNPVTDSENGKHLTNAFTKQIIKDFRVDLMSDPNYDPSVFKNLAQAMTVEKS
jgi:hypothetical protein